jgi:hypothetical protein
MWVETLQWQNNIVSLLLMQDVQKNITQIEEGKFIHNQIWLSLSLD